MENEKITQRWLRLGYWKYKKNLRVSMFLIFRSGLSGESRSLIDITWWNPWASIECKEYLKFFFVCLFYQRFVQFTNDVICTINKSNFCSLNFLTDSLSDTLKKSYYYVHSISCILQTFFYCMLRISVIFFSRINLQSH